MPETLPIVAISWHRLPPYAAHLIRAGLEAFDGTVYVVASRPVALTEEVEAIIGRELYWIESEGPVQWSELNLPVPDIFFQAGWSSKSFRELGSQVKQAGGKVICLSDNSWKNTPRQWISALTFRVRSRTQFDAVWVPGESGKLLMKMFGVPAHLIYQGLYGANPEVFSPGASLEKRNKRFIFVGQLIERKGLATLVEAFEKFHFHFPDWTLKIIGSGPLRSVLKEDSGIEIEGFQSPHHVAQAMKQSRFLLLPSYEDHWGLVVHEAVSSGCGVVASDTVGAALDLVNADNGYEFSAGDAEGLYQALVLAAQKDDCALEKCFQVSLRLAKKFGTQLWADTFRKIIEDSFNRPSTSLY